MNSNQRIIHVTDTFNINTLRKQISVRHPSDPPSGFPITLHITPAIVDLCQACARVPASVAIVGDIRLGQSPCKLCGPCWRMLGEPTDGENITVVPMLKHELGCY